MTLSLSAAASAQTPEGGPEPSQMRVRIGPLWLNPRVELSNLGVDTNVFNVPSTKTPQSDFTATVTPTTDIWFRMGMSWLQINIREDVVWYQKFDTERSANSGYDVTWRVPGDTVMSGEYHGRVEVMEFLRRTGLETGGTYRSALHTVFADDDWAVAIYRARGMRNGVDLDVEQALVIRIRDGMWIDVTAVPLDPSFAKFWT